MSRAKKAPFFTPTLFLNHENRERYVEERDKRCPKTLPENCVDAYNLFLIVNKGIIDSFQRTNFLNHSRGCELIYLKKEFSPELAFEEVMMSKPFIYSKNIDTKKKSKYIDPDHSNREHGDYCTPQNKGSSFIVEFCVIYPENKMSTVIVSCATCGLCAETVLDESSMNVLKKELTELSMSLEIGADEPHLRAVIPLPDDTVCVREHSAFCEGIIGITPLISVTPLKPSIFMRVRIKYGVNSRSLVRRLIHENEGGEREVYPDYAEQY